MTFLRDTNGLKPWEERMLREREAEEPLRECDGCGNVVEESILAEIEDELLCPNCYWDRLEENEEED